MELYLLALVGTILHIAFDFKKTISKLGFDEALKSYKWNKHIAFGIIGFLSVATLIFIKEDIKGIIIFTPVVALMSGFAGDSLFRNLLLNEKKKIKEVKK